MREEGEGEGEEEEYFISRIKNTMCNQGGEKKGTQSTDCDGLCADH